MRLPEIRDALADLERKLVKMAAEVGTLRREIKRRPLVKKPAARKAKHMTPQLRAMVRSLSDQHPELSQLEIAKHFDINPGRVSEALRGYRE